ncbi:Methyltransferase domain-containing protein [Geodermatophilus amargosae]|uniref:Methyltransferase domain-containing protein n=1 Tax=Geodermatophilus amargosae TaxID=1296565 RepID=A0A1I7CCY3_9ACTN|nr:class I SAM-dependent methyltransferase [Geodermatophilus amargosae]SFT97289.1 Methyltransferase domain-containing protein [Geodermatophilus amargosae]
MDDVRSTVAGTGYVLGNDDPALSRVDALSRVHAPATAAWLHHAGLAPGTSVADLGCGTGAVALAAARRVGPAGRVVGVDTAPQPLAVARRRAAAAGHRGVVLEQADVTTWEPPGPVDAVLGRLVLLHLPDPVALVGADGPAGALVRLGVPADLGLRLDAVFRDAGLPDPVLVTGQPLERGGSATGWSIVGGDVTALADAFERTGTATAAEVGPADLEQRLRAQAADAGAVLVDPLVVGAVARVP